MGPLPKPGTHLRQVTGGLGSRSRDQTIRPPQDPGPRGSSLDASACWEAAPGDLGSRHLEGRYHWNRGLRIPEGGSATAEAVDRVAPGP